MTNMERVLHGLDSCGSDYGIPNICEVTECPYRETSVSCVHDLAHDAMMLISELLKAQEPIMRSSRKSINGFSLVWTCGNCGKDLKPNNRAAKYCYNCGRAVKWDG